MTNEHAIDILTEEHDYAQLLSYVNEALSLAIEALEKQIPKKAICCGDNPNYSPFDASHSKRYICPCKKHSVEPHFGGNWYCERRGQLIDWSDEE